MELVKERKTPLLGRTRYTFSLRHDQETPSRLSLKEQVAKQIKVDKEKVIIKHVYTHFGTQEGKIIAHVYDDASLIPILEHKSLVKKHAPVEPDGEKASESAETSKEAPAEETAPGEKADEVAKSEEAAKEAPAEEAEKTE